MYIQSYLPLNSLNNFITCNKYVNSFSRLHPPLQWNKLRISWSKTEWNDHHFLQCTSSKRYTQLQSLIIVDCNHITRSGLEVVCKNYPKLKKLHIVGCQLLTI